MDQGGGPLTHLATTRIIRHSLGVGQLDNPIASPRTPHFLELNHQCSFLLCVGLWEQFFGSHPTFDPAKVWSTHADPKCKFFAWLALHERILTTDMLALRGWPHDPRCLLCLQEPETANHLCKDCPFSVTVWNQENTWTNKGLPISGYLLEPGNMSEWWDMMLANQLKQVHRRHNRRIFYTLWSIWKEQNRCIFTRLHLTHHEALLESGSLPSAS